jgi:hypothetical protein
MPIEDVDYLRQNSVRQSYVFMIDSGDRDHYAYPTPSSYTVTFDKPFNNVIGFEVLDASVPRTMYNVDGGNPLYPTRNTIAFYIHDDSCDITQVNPSTYTIVSVDPGDYTVQTLIQTINTSSTLQMNVNNDSSQPLASISIEAVSNPPDVKSVLRFRCPYPFVIDMQQSTMAETLGFDTLTTAYNQSSLAPIDKLYTSFTPSNLVLQSQTDYHQFQMYHSVDLASNIGLGKTNVIYNGPRGITRKLPVDSTVNVIAQSFTVPYTCYLTDVSAAVATTNNVISGQVSWTLHADANGIPGSNLLLQNTLGLIETNYIDGGLSTTVATVDTANPIYATLDAGKYWIVFKGTQVYDGLMNIYYNDVPLSQGESLGQFMLASSDGGQTYTNTLDNIADGLQYNVSMQVTTQDSYHVLTAPGLYSLIGEKYAILRCKEIEESSYRSLAYTKHCLGLAKFKLGVVGYSENRVDFSKVPLREFHPIGKLSKLSFRFETASGLLYDFKGVNHHITYAIYYYEPSQKLSFEKSLMNPNYTGNFIKDMDLELEEDSDDQEYDYNHDEFDRMYQSRESRHLPDNILRLDKEAMYKFALDDPDED